MKFVVDRENFLRGINISSRAVSTNNTLPILANILLRAENGRLFFESTNLEIAISYNTPILIDNEGKITIPARLFQNYLSLLSDKEVNVNLSDGFTINVQTSNAKTQIKGLSAQDFPKMPIVEKKWEIKMPALKFGEAISQVVFAASSSSSRPILSGVYLYGKEKTLKMVATDSYRLAEKTLELNFPLSEELKAIIPARTLIELGRLIGEDHDEEIVLVVSDNQILFRLGNIELISRLIDGQFPNYSQIIPLETSSKISILKMDILPSIKRVALFARENNNNIKISSNPETQKISITTDATQIGTEETELMAKVEGEENKIALNSDYLLDLLNSLPNGEITLAVHSKLSPVLLKHQNYPDYLHIIMPLKI